MKKNSIPGLPALIGILIGIVVSSVYFLTFSGPKVEQQKNDAVNKPPPVTTKKSKPTDGDTTARSKLADLSLSVVNVGNEEGWGTGYVVKGPSGKPLIVTAAHVVDRAQSIFILAEIPDPDEPSKMFQVAYPATQILAIDFFADLAVLGIDNLPENTLAPLPINYNESECGKSSRLCGFPATIYARGRLHRTCQMLASATLVDLDSMSDWGGRNIVHRRAMYKGIVLKSDAEPGNSGGPLFNDQGEVVATLLNKSPILSQAGAICNVNLRPLLERAETGMEVTTQEVEKLINDLVQNYLPFISDQQNSRNHREYLHPEFIANATRAFSAVMWEQFMLEMFQAKDPAAEARAQAFTHQYPLVAKLIDPKVCPTDPLAATFSCLGEQAAPALFAGWFEQNIGDLKSTQANITVTDVKEVDKEKKVYECLLSIKIGDKVDRKMAQVRLDMGKLWLYIPEQSLLVALPTPPPGAQGPVAGATATDQGSANAPIIAAMVGTWATEAEGQEDQGDIESSVKMTLEISPKGNQLKTNFKYYYEATRYDGQEYDCYESDNIVVNYKVTALCDLIGSICKANEPSFDYDDRCVIKRYGIIDRIEIELLNKNELIIRRHWNGEGSTFTEKKWSEDKLKKVE